MGTERHGRSYRRCGERRCRDPLGSCGKFCREAGRRDDREAGEGRESLAEEIEVRLPFATKKTDEEIAAAALGRLAWDVSVPNDAVKVKVEKGRITLTGQVDWQYQRQAAEHDVRGLYGVVGTSNQIKNQSKGQHVEYQRRHHARPASFVVFRPEGSVDNLSRCFCGSRLDCIVPFAVKVVAKDIQFGHFLVGDFDPGGIEVFIEFGNGTIRPAVEVVAPISSTIVR